MRVKIARLLMLFMMMTMFLNLNSVDASAEKDRLEVKVSIGYDNNYKVGYSTPVSLEIKNIGENFDGEVEIRVPSTPGKYISYAKKLNLEKNAEKNIKLNVPVNGVGVKYKLIISSGKETYYQKSISFNMTSNNVTQFIGILSDDFDSLTYINKVPAAQGVTVNTKTIKLDEKILPEDTFSMKAFDIIIINNFDTSKLSSVQYNILKTWVRDGGTLIVGTGSNHKKTLGVFQDDFIKGTSAELKTISTSKIYELASNGDNKKAVGLEVLDLKVEKSLSVLEDNENKLTHTLSVGKGKVGIAAFDLGQAPFSNWSNNTAFAEKLIGLIGTKTIMYDQGGYIGKDSYMIREILNQFSEMGSIKTSHYYIILFIYIIVVAPLSYFILYKIDKRELMWVVVPITAVIFGGIIYVSGLGSRISKVTTNMVTMYNIDKEGNASTTTYAGIFSTKKTRIRVEGKNGEIILPITEQYYGDPNQVVNNEDLEAKIYADGSNGLEYVNTSILQTKMVEVQRESINIGKVQAELSIKNGSILGAISNETNFDLEDCYVITPTEFYKIGDIKIGENKELGKKEGSYGGYIHELVDRLFYNRMNMYNPGAPGQTNTTYMENMQKANMLRMLYNNGGQALQGISLIGFSKNSTGTELLVNKLPTTINERSLIMMPIELTFKNGEYIEYPKGFIPSTVLQTGALKYDPYSSRIFGSGDTEVIFSIDRKIKVEELYLDYGQNNYGTAAPVISLFNFISGEYEVISKDSIPANEVEKFVDRDNQVKLKIEINNSDAAVPKLGAKGKVQ